MLPYLVRMIAALALRAEWRCLRDQVAVELRRIDSSPDQGVSLVAQQLLISGEDHRHGAHAGFDLIAIARALWQRMKGKREGASTIEQQIVRVLTGRFELTIRRKLREILLASLLAYHFRKEVLPALYLRIGYYGWRMNGLTQACHRLRIDQRAMSLHEAAAIVARLKYPDPRLCSLARATQIQCRAIHLMRLYERHLPRGLYGHLSAASPTSAISSRRLAQAPAGALS